MTLPRLKEPDSPAMQIAKSLSQAKVNGLKFKGNSIRKPYIKMYLPKIKGASLKGNGMFIKLQNIPNDVKTFKLK